MPETAEPSQPPRRKRPLLRWIILGMAVFVCAGGFVLFKWGDSEKMPSFGKVWKLRGQVSYSQIRYGRDSRETLDARWKLASVLMKRSSYGSAQGQWKEMLACAERVHGANSSIAQICRFLSAACLFLNGRSAQARQLLVAEMKRVERSSNLFSVSNYCRFILCRLRAFESEFPEHSSELARFVLEQAHEVYENEPPILRLYQNRIESFLQGTNNVPPTKPVLP